MCFETVRGRPCSWWREGKVVVVVAGRGGSVRANTDPRIGLQTQSRQILCDRLALVRHRRGETHGLEWLDSGCRGQGGKEWKAESEGTE